MSRMSRQTTTAQFAINSAYSQWSRPASTSSASNVRGKSLKKVCAAHSVEQKLEGALLQSSMRHYRMRSSRKWEKLSKFGELN